MKVKRRFSFEVRKVFTSEFKGLNTTYSYVSDSTLINECLRLAKKYDCEITNFKSKDFKKTIIIKADKVGFLGFVNSFVSDLDGDIKEIKF